MLSPFVSKTEKLSNSSLIVITITINCLFCSEEGNEYLYKSWVSSESVEVDSIFLILSPLPLTTSSSVGSVSKKWISTSKLLDTPFDTPNSNCIFSNADVRK